MPRFQYEGRDKTGNLKKGVIVAASTENVASQLINDGITPIRINALRGQFDFSAFVRSLNQKKITGEVLLVFCRQMHSLIKAGVPVVSTVSRLIEILPASELTRTLTAVETQLSAGESLSSAMKRYPTVFSKLIIALVTAGEANGRLDEAFLQASKHYELETTTLKRVKGALRYPAFVMLAVALAVTVINVFVVPKFASLYKSFHSTLPLPTRILINTSNFMINYWWVILIAICLIWLLIIYLLKNPEVIKKVDLYRLKIPIFGDIMERTLMASFARCLSMLIQTGVPLLQGLTLTADVVNNSYAKEKILKMRESIERGETLSSAAKKAHFFSSLVLQMISVGEETGNVDKTLLEISEFYEREVDYDIKQLADKMEPILLLAVGGVVLILALGVFLPMWDMVYIVK